MRRRPAVLAALALSAALALAACSDDAEPSGDGTASETATAADAAPTPAGTEMPTVDGAFGEDPTVTFPGTGAPAELQVEVLEEGDGAEVGPDDYVVAHYAGKVWDTEDWFDSSFERGAPSGFFLNQVVQGWKEGLAGTHVGDRVLLSIPPELGYGEDGRGEDIPGGSTLVFVVDVVDTYAPDAAGPAGATPVEPAPELPVTVEGEVGATASIAVNEGAPEPTEPVTTVVATGTGDPVGDTPGTTVLVQFAETLWDNTQQTSTWDQGGLTTVMVGDGSVFDQLADVPVGSRVVMQIPGSQDQPSLAAVVDIVGTVPAPQQG